MRAGVAAVLLASLTIAVAAALGGSSATSLTVTFWTQGRDASQAKRWTLECNPVGGTHPNRARACATLARLGDQAFAPIPRDVVCTQIYGGPQDAIVTGTYRDRMIWARFRRRDGCEIGRWRRHEPLVPAVATR
jgi:hypothetical protein